MNPTRIIIDTDPGVDDSLTFLLALASFVPAQAGVYAFELVVNDDLAEQAEHAIVMAARTEKIGDGKVFTYDCERAVRIRTGERGPEAL